MQKLTNKIQNWKDTNMSKSMKDMLTEVSDLEKRYVQVVNRRIELLAELSKLEAEESEINNKIVSKKTELRRQSSAKENPVISTSSSGNNNNTTSPLPLKKRPPQLTSSTRTFSVQLLNANQAKKDMEEEATVLQKTVSTKEGKKPKTKPKLLDKIEPDDQSIFSPKILLNSPKLFELIPKLKCEELKEPKRGIIQLDGPNLPDNGSSLNPPPAEAYNDFVCAKTISTYPLNFTKDGREGDPICDRFYAKLFSNRAVVALADGCNWGPRPKDAAVKACAGFCEYVSQEMSLKDLKEAGNVLLKGLACAHNKIIEGKDDVWEAGTTTLLGGFLLELRDPEDSESQFGFLCASVGDCKAFHWSRSTGKLVDITVGNRANLTDASDPGGRLGPYLKGGMPDLRNLDLFFETCAKGDIILVVSDGVHDNIDPQMLGKSPKDLGLESETWKDAEQNETDDAEEAKTIHRNAFLENQINELSKSKNFSLIDICQNLVQHCWYLTKKSREFMEQNPNKKLPGDYETYPGKMDHTTVVAIRVGYYT